MNGRPPSALWSTWAATPLAQAMGLDLPQDIEEEREMWRMISRMSRTRYHYRAAALNRFRSSPSPSDPPCTGG